MCFLGCPLPPLVLVKQMDYGMRQIKTTDKIVNELLNHLAPNCYIGHGLSSFSREDAAKAVAFIRNDLLASASEGFDEWCNANVARYFGLGTFQRELDEKIWQACSISHAKKMQEKDEEINFIKGVNSRLEEVRQSMLDVIDEKDAEIGMLQKENEELRKDLIILCRELLGGAGDVYLQTLANQYQLKWLKGNASVLSGEEAK